MEAGKPNSIVEQLHFLSGVEGEEFKQFVTEIISSSESEIKTLDDLRSAIAHYLQKQLGDLM